MRPYSPRISLAIVLVHQQFGQKQGRVLHHECDQRAPVACRAAEGTDREALIRGEITLAALACSSRRGLSCPRQHPSRLCSSSLPIPSAVLQSAGGGLHALRKLALRRRRLLVAVDCPCTSAHVTIGNVDDWQKRLSRVDVRVMTTSRPKAQGRVATFPSATLLDRGRTVGHRDSFHPEGHRRLDRRDRDGTERMKEVVKNQEWPRIERPITELAKARSAHP